MLSRLRVPSPVAMIRSHTRNHTTSHDDHEATGTAFHVCLESPTAPATRTVVTVSGISCNRTFELCSACPTSAVFEKLSVVVSYDQRECWIPASVVDIASVGARGRYLGWRYKTSVQPAARWWWWGRNPHPEVDLEKASVRSTAELVELAALLPIMAMEMRNVELRLCRGGREVHVYRVVAVVVVMLVLLSTVACSWFNSAHHSNAAATGVSWFQSILVNLVSSLVFGGIAWTFWRPRDE